MSNRSPLRIHLLGRFQVSLDQQVIPQAAWRLRSAAALIKLLALAPDHRMHREQLMDALWPESDAEADANNLRYSLLAASRMLTAFTGSGDFLQQEGGMQKLGPWDVLAAAWKEGRHMSMDDAINHALADGCNTRREALSIVQT